MVIMGTHTTLKIIWTAVILITAAVALASGQNVMLNAQADSGGTDNEIEMFGDTSGGAEWNEVHGFVIVDNDEKVGDPFNVTLCQEVKSNKDGGYSPSGNIFGSLDGIIWDDDPEPTITVSQEDFDIYKDDQLTLTLHALGEYIREGPGGDELRQGYKEITIRRPNHAPTPVVMIANSDNNGNGMWDNWSLIEDIGTELIYYIDSEGIEVQFYLNGSESSDVDGDNVTEFRWDLDEDGEFGGESRERKMNTTIYLGEGDHILSLIVGDGDKYSETPLDFRIVIRQPIRYPDLTINNVEIINKNGLENFEKGNKGTITMYIKNIGDEELYSHFDLLVEYWFRDMSPEPTWEYLDEIRVAETIGVNGLRVVDIPWDTGKDEFLPGIYSFRVTVDSLDEINELREQNNIFQSENVTITQDETPGTPDLRISNISSEKYRLKVNEFTNITLKLENRGDGAATWLDIHYLANNEYQHMQTIEELHPGMEEERIFTFSPDSEYNYSLRFEIYDNGEKKITSQTIIIEGYKPPDPDPPQPNGTNNTGIPFIYIVGGAALIVIPSVIMAVVKLVKKREDDMVW